MASDSPTDEEIIARCEEMFELQIDDDYFHPGLPQIDPEQASLCESLSTSLFRSRQTELHRRLRRIKGSLVHRGCDVNISCSCCEERYLGGEFQWNGSSTGFIGGIRLCYNNLDEEDYLPTLIHELTHAAQRCYGRSEEGCDDSLKAEIESYFCEGGCRNARECIFQAVASSCGSSPDLCNAITPEKIQSLIRWYNRNWYTFCEFPRTHFDPVR